MKKVKAVLWVIIIGIFGLVVFQNQEFFLAPESLGIDLYFFSYRAPELPTAVLFAGFFLVGWLLAYLLSLADRYRCNRLVKGLRQNIAGQQAAIDDLKKDIQSLKADTPSAEQPAAQQPFAETAAETGAASNETPDPPLVKQDRFAFLP